MAETKGLWLVHVEDAADPEIPRVLLRWPLFDENRHALVDGASDLRVPARSEDRRRARIGIDAGEILGSQLDASFLVLQVGHFVREEHEPARCPLSAAAPA